MEFSISKYLRHFREVRTTKDAAAAIVSHERLSARLPKMGDRFESGLLDMENNALEILKIASVEPPDPELPKQLPTYAKAVLYYSLMTRACIADRKATEAASQALNLGEVWTEMRFNYEWEPLARRGKLFPSGKPKGSKSRGREILMEIRQRFPNDQAKKLWLKIVGPDSLTLKIESAAADQLRQEFGIKKIDADTIHFLKRPGGQPQGRPMQFGSFKNAITDIDKARRARLSDT